MKKHHATTKKAAPKKDAEVQTPQEPKGIPSRVEAEKARVLEILAAIARYVQASKCVPDEWREELDELLDRQEEESHD